jgi:hypothetical protein
MSKQALALHIGLNSVDPAHYGGWQGRLAACEFDAHDMQAIAQAQGFATQLLLTAAATAEAVQGALSRAAATLKSGDTLLITYSGHGGQVPDTNDDEPDGQDETWALYDRELVDDELYELWAQFAPGVRIVVFSDSCHSGTVTRALPFYQGIKAQKAPKGRKPQPDTRLAELRFRVLPDAVRRRTYAKELSINKCHIWGKIE